MYSYLFVFIFFYLCEFLSEAHEAQLCVNICPPCLPQDLENCPKLPTCAHVVKPHGCGRCCDVCALSKGERCGVTLPPCEPGLECRGATEQGTLTAILLNQATCQSVQSNSQPRQVRSIKRKSSRRRTTRHPHRGLLAALNYDGPCSRHLESVMTSCGTLPLVAWIPDCIRGFYRPKQCVTSGGSLGKCWCVNRFGEAIGTNSDTSDNLRCPTV